MKIQLSTHRLLLLFLLGLLLAGMRPFQASALARSNAIDANAIDGYMTAQMQAARLPGAALAIVQGDQIVYLILVAAVGALVNLAFPDLARALFGSRVAGQASGFALVTLPIVLYFALLESSAWQASWGKHKCGLRVVDARGARLSRARALGRTALAFVPWELSHTLIWQIRFAPAESPALVTAGFALVWLLVGANIASLVLRPAHQTLYDWLAGTYVVAASHG